MEKLHEYVVRQIKLGTRKHFSRLHRDYLQERESEIMSTQYSSTTTTGLNVKDDSDKVLRETLRPVADNPESLGTRAKNQNGAAGSGVTSGMSAQQNSEVRAIRVQEVDSTVICGSHKGAPSEKRNVSTDEFKNQGGPRTQMGQQKSSKFESDTEPFSSSTAGSEGDRA
jgi:hypothetical protein